MPGCSLNVSPRANWVEQEGGLPNYICRIARALIRSGKSRQNAIQIAISRVKVWAAGGGDVNADTRAKAAKAVAEWESKKARAKARPNKKRKAGLSATEEDDIEWFESTEYEDDFDDSIFRFEGDEVKVVVSLDDLVKATYEGTPVEKILELANREFSTDTRKRLAGKGVAMPDGSFPIPDRDALRRAIQSFGRAKPEDRAAVKRHIIKRARALGATSMLPEGWA